MLNMTNEEFDLMKDYCSDCKGYPYYFDEGCYKNCDGFKEKLVELREDLLNNE